MLLFLCEGAKKRSVFKFFDHSLILDCFCKNMKVKKSKVVSIEGRA